MKPLALLSSLSSGLYLFGSIYAMRSQRLPNVLFILVDDYGIKDVGIEGGTFYETPHIDNPGWQPGPTWWKSLVPDN